MCLVYSETFHLHHNGSYSKLLIIQHHFLFFPFPYIALVTDLTTVEVLKTVKTCHLEGGMLEAQGTEKVVGRVRTVGERTGVLDILLLVLR